MDIVDPQTRSRMMAGIRSKDTRPEMTVRTFLHERGFRYRLHVARLPGHPDIVLTRYRVAIFVHGCFWHQHTGCPKASMPRDNAEKWATKFAGNVARDQKNVPALIDMGWHVIVIWECGLGKKIPLGQLDWLVEAIRAPQTTFREWPLLNKRVLA
jgi:DNA mismatch endonuclease (patch repair protein)